MMRNVLWMLVAAMLAPSVLAEPTSAPEAGPEEPAPSDAANGLNGTDSEESDVQPDPQAESPAEHIPNVTEPLCKLSTELCSRYCPSFYSEEVKPYWLGTSEYFGFWYPYPVTESGQTYYFGSGLSVDEKCPGGDSNT